MAGPDEIQALNNASGSFATDPSSMNGSPQVGGGQPTTYTGDPNAMHPTAPDFSSQEFDANNTPEGAMQMIDVQDQNFVGVLQPLGHGEEQWLNGRFSAQDFYDTFSNDGVPPKAATVLAADTAAQFNQIEALTGKRLEDVTGDDLAAIQPKWQSIFNYFPTKDHPHTMAVMYNVENGQMGPHNLWNYVNNREGGIPGLQDATWNTSHATWQLVAIDNKIEHFMGNPQFDGTEWAGGGDPGDADANSPQFHASNIANLLNHVERMRQGEMFDLPYDGKIGGDGGMSSGAQTDSASGGASGYLGWGMQSLNPTDPNADPNRDRQTQAV